MELLQALGDSGLAAWLRRPGLRDLSLEKVGSHWFMHNTPVPRLEEDARLER